MSNLFSEADIKRLVHVFYGDVRKDAMLAPIFATKIPEDHWPAHMAHICDFWSSVFLQTVAQSFQMGLAMHYQNKGADNPFAQFGLKPPS